MASGIEDVVGGFYNSLRTLPRNGDKYYLVNSKSLGREHYFKVGVRPNRFSPFARMKTFEELISQYLSTSLGEFDKTGPYKVKMANHLFRSRIKIETPYKTVIIRVPKFSYLFGNRVKVKFRNYNPSLKKTETPASN